MSKLFLIFLLALLTGCDDMCGSELLKTELSPNKNFKAVSYLYDCGATSGFSTQVSVLKANEKISSPGNIFTTEGKNNLELKWLSNESLEISNTKNIDSYKQKRKFKEITIFYK